MRIMLVVNEFPPEKIAGTAMATKALAEQLSARGHRVLVLVTAACPEALRNTIEATDYQLIWMTQRPIRGLGMLWRLWQAWRIARHFRPQLIQGQAVSCGLIAAVVGRVLQVPSICYAQGYDVYEATPRQQRTEIRWGCAWPDKLLVVTQDLATAIRDVTGISTVQVMPHAFSLPEPMPVRDAVRRQYNLSGSDFVVLSIGRLELFKGHDVLINAWPDVVRQYSAAQLWIAGSGSRRQVLEEQVRALDIASSVHFVGQLSAGQVHRRLAAADLFVLPSRSEPFGIVLLEAMAHGLPIVASHVGGIPEVVPVQGDVRLLPVDDVEAVKTAILERCAVSFATSEVNRQHAMGFEWYQQVKRFEAIYRHLLS